MEPKIKYELTSPKEHLNFSGIEIDHWYITAFWRSESGMLACEPYGYYDTQEEAEAALERANKN
mgnify:CR=1 FL=1